jgi:MFS family permease
MKIHKQKWFSRDLIGFSLTSFFNDFNHEMTTAILPLFVSRLIGLAYAPQALGLITGISSLAMAGANLIGGWLGEKIRNQKILLVIGYAITPIFSSCIGMAHSISSILMLRTIAWSGRGMRDPVRDSWLAKLLRRADYGKAFGLERSMDTLGATLGPLCAYFALFYFDLKYIFFLALIPGLLSVVTITLLVKNYEIEEYSSSKKSFLNELYTIPVQFKQFLCIRFLFGLANFDPVLIIFRAQEMLSGKEIVTVVAAGSAILFYIVFNVINLVGSLGLGFLSDYNRFSKKNLLAVVGFGIFGVVNILLINQSVNVWGWLFIFILAGLSTSAVVVLEKACTAEMLPESRLSNGYGILLMIGGLSSLFAGFMVGALWSYISAQSGFVYAAVLSFFAMILLLLTK